MDVQCVCVVEMEMNRRTDETREVGADVMKPFFSILLLLVFIFTFSPPI